MLGELATAPEGLPAVLTLVGLLSCVDSPMDHEARAPSEGLPAVFTFIRFLASVDFLMLSKLDCPNGRPFYILYIDKASHLYESSDAE